MQKGPYINGSSINIFELDNSYSATGKIYNTQIADNSGTFQVNNISLVSPYISMQANGYYFNEVTGALSASQLTLNGISNINNGSTVNVNLLTYLEKARVEYLLSQGISFSDAKSQAQYEVLAIFNISPSSIQSSEYLDISQSGEGNAILLAISAILQGYRTESELSELLSNISSDIRTDGILNSSSLGSFLINHAVSLDTLAIRNNLVSRYNDLGISATIPAFEPYLRNFIDNTSFQITGTVINYPATGLYDDNFLSLSQTTYSASSYSLSAELPEGTALKIKIKRLSGNSSWSIQMGTENNWSISLYNGSTNEQFFTAINSNTTCDLKMLFGNDSTVTTTCPIEYYEMNSFTPTRIKTIAVN